MQHITARMLHEAACYASYAAAAIPRFDDLSIEARLRYSRMAQWLNDCGLQPAPQDDDPHPLAPGYIEMEDEDEDEREYPPISEDDEADLAAQIQQSYPAMDDEEAARVARHAYTHW